MTMATRRIPISRPERSLRFWALIQVDRSSQGMTRSLQTMVDKAMVSTITIPVAADKPPMNTRTASASAPCAIGKVRTKVSAE